MFLDCFFTHLLHPQMDRDRFYDPCVFFYGLIAHLLCQGHAPMTMGISQLFFTHFLSFIAIRDNFQKVWTYIHWLITRPLDDIFKQATHYI